MNRLIEIYNKFYPTPVHYHFTLVAYYHFIDNQFRGTVDLSKLSVTDLKKISEFYESMGFYDLANGYK